MRSSLQTLCTQFIANRNILKKTCRWESSYLYPICAAVFLDRHKTADPDRLLECKHLVRAQTGAFSSFRGIGKPVVLSLLAVENNPEEKWERMRTQYALLRQSFSGAQYLPLAAALLTEPPVRFSAEALAARTRKIFKLMKAAHPVLTGSEDVVFAALMALSDRPEEAVLAEAEACYGSLQKEFNAGNAVQSLSFVLALAEGDTAAKCEKTLALYNELRALGYAYGRRWELAELGALAQLPASPRQLAQEVAEVCDFLHTQKGYSAVGLDKKQRLLHAGLLVVRDYTGGSAAGGQDAGSARLSLVAAQQAAMLAAIAAAAAASAAASS